MREARRAASGFALALILAGCWARGGAAPDAMAQANAALQAGEADKALGLLSSLSGAGAQAAEGHNLLCRVRLTLEEWDAAESECEQAVKLNTNDSNYHLWLGRALGERASRAGWMTAFSLAKRTRAEFEEAVQLDGRNAEALSDLGDFYRQAPGVVGGGVDKAEKIAADLDKVSPARADALRAAIAEQQKDFGTAESEYKKAIAADAHPGDAWETLAAFYARQKRYGDMDAAIKSAAAAAERDRRSSVALYDCAGLLTENKREPELAATLLEQYLAAAGKTEEAPAFVAHLRLAKLKLQLGDKKAADQERAAALGLAHEYRPALEFRAG